MAVFNYKPSGTCSTNIHLDIEEDGTINEIIVENGCHGTSQGLSALARGRHADEVADLLNGIICKRSKKTSCPDQIALAIQAWKEQQAA